ncbi:MAG: hypothetical protein AAGF12_42045 [Myxococcota bacterium]
MASPPQQSSLPPTDHVARVLLKNGARDHALRLLHAAVERDPGEKACAALLRAVEARPDASVYGPDLDLTFDLVQAYTRSGMLMEALAVVEGAGLVDSDEGRVRAEGLRELLAPVPEGADLELREVDRQLRTGGASVALTMLDQRKGNLPAWAERRHQLLSSLLLDAAVAAPSAPELQTSDSPLGKALDECLRARDLKGAAKAAREYTAQHPGDTDASAVAVALDRIVDGMGALSKGMGPGAVLRTVPMTGHTVAMFQLRMGNLENAERMFRKIVLEDAMDEVARQRLDDIQTLRSVLEGRPVQVPSNAGRASAPSSPPPKVDPLMETMSVSDDELDRSIREAQELSGLKRMPTGADDESHPRIRFDDDEPATGQMSARDSAEMLRRMEAPEELEAEATRQVHLSVPPEVRRPPTSPELLKKNTRPQLADYQSSDDSDEWEDASTTIGTPEEQAELLMKQGFHSHALSIYEVLAQKHPTNTEYIAKTAELRRLVRDVGPVARPSVQPAPAQPASLTPVSAQLQPPMVQPPMVDDEDVPTLLHEDKAPIDTAKLAVEATAPSLPAAPVGLPPPRQSTASPAPNVSGHGPTPPVGVSASESPSLSGPPLRRWDDETTRVSPDPRYYQDDGKSANAATVRVSRIIRIE